MLLNLKILKSINVILDKNDLLLDNYFIQGYIELV